MMPEEETCFCCLRISQQKRRAEDIWLEAGTTAWVRSSRGVSRCCTDKKVPQVCWLPGSDHSMASNLIKFFYCKYGGLSDSLPCLTQNSRQYFRCYLIRLRALACSGTTHTEIQIIRQCLQPCPDPGNVFRSPSRIHGLLKENSLF